MPSLARSTVVVLAALAAPATAAAGAGSDRFVLAWPPTRYARAEVVVFRADDDAGVLEVRVAGRGIDVTAPVPLGAAARVTLPAEARCAGGIDACAIVVERVSGAGTFHVVLQSPDTSGAADTLLLTAHDTVRVPPPASCDRRVVVVSAPNASLTEFPETLSFASVVPVAGAACVVVTSGCAAAADVTVALPDVLTLSCAGPGEDLTGTVVEADRPVLVLSGNVATTVPVEAGLSADLVLDAVLPATRTTTLVVPPLPRGAAWAGQGDVVRLVASGDVTVRVRDDRGRDESRALSVGEWWDVDTAGTAADVTLRVEADGPVHAWHLPKSRARRGMGDPAAIPIVPRELFTTSDRFFLPDGYAEANALVVVAEIGTTVLLDGMPLPALQAAPGAGLGWIRVALATPPSGPGAVHELSADGAFGAWVVGFGGYKAHGSAAALEWPAAQPEGTAVLRGLVPTALTIVARVTTGAWADTALDARAFYRVDDAAAVLRVTRCGGNACLRW